MKKKWLYGLGAVAFMVPVALVAHAGSGHSWGKHGWGHGEKRMMRSVCNPHKIERRQERQALMARYIGIEADQQDEWQALKAVRKTNAEAVLALCEEIKAEGRPTSTSERLDRKERFLTLRLENLQRLRPAAEAFEAVLNEDQKDAIKELRRHMKGKRWGKHRKWQDQDSDNNE